MTVSYVEENLFQISRPAIYRQADPLTVRLRSANHVISFRQARQSQSKHFAKRPQKQGCLLGAGEESH